MYALNLNLSLNVVNNKQPHAHCSALPVILSYSWINKSFKIFLCPFERPEPGLYLWMHVQTLYTMGIDRKPPTLSEVTFHKLQSLSTCLQIVGPILLEALFLDCSLDWRKVPQNKKALELSFINMYCSTFNYLPPPICTPRRSYREALLPTKAKKMNMFVGDLHSSIDKNHNWTEG